MPIQPQYNIATLRDESPEVSDPKLLGRWITQYIVRRLNQLFRGPTSRAVTLGSAATLSLNEFALHTGILTVGTAITLDLLHTRAGSFGYVELTQDSTGGWAVSWVNASWTNGTPPTIAAGAGKKTLLLFVHNGSAWVGSVLASNY